MNGFGPVPFIRRKTAFLAASLIFGNVTLGGRHSAEKYPEAFLTTAVSMGPINSTACEQAVWSPEIISTGTLK
jgi:hypothetical protein